jgi:phage-related protein
MTNAYNWGTGLMGELGKGVASTVTAIGTEAGNIWTAISNVLGTAKFEGIGSGILAGIQTGVASKIVELTGYITGGMQAIVDAVKRIFNIRSPSRVMADIGANLMIGMERGMINNIPGVINAAQLMAAGVLGVANGMSLSPSMALSASAMGSASTGNIIRPSVTNNATYNLNYQTMQSAGSVQQDVELLNLLYGGAV